MCVYSFSSIILLPLDDGHVWGGRNNPYIGTLVDDYSPANKERMYGRNGFARAPLDEESKSSRSLHVSLVGVLSLGLPSLIWHGTGRTYENPP